MKRPSSNASASAAQDASLSTNTGSPSRSVSSSRSGTSSSGMFTLERIRPVSKSTTDGTPTPTARTSSCAQRLDRLHELLDQRVAVVERGLDERALGQLAVAQRGRRDLGAPDVEADEAVAHSFDAAASSSSTVSAP